MTYWRIVASVAAVLAVAAVPSIILAALIEWNPAIGLVAVIATCVFGIPAAVLVLERH